MDHPTPTLLLHVVHGVNLKKMAEQFKGSVAWLILVNAIYVFFWTTARSVRETDPSSTDASVSRMLHARDCCCRVVLSGSLIIPDWPKLGHIKDTYHATPPLMNTYIILGIYCGNVTSMDYSYGIECSHLDNNPHHTVCNV